MRIATTIAFAKGGLYKIVIFAFQCHEDCDKLTPYCSAPKMRGKNREAMCLKYLGGSNTMLDAATA